jgi:hypothetical protein
MLQTKDEMDGQGIVYSTSMYFTRLLFYYRKQKFAFPEQLEREIYR